MKHERAFVFITLIIFGVLTIGQYFSLVDKEFKIQSLEQKQEYLKERLVKMEAYTHAH